MSEEEIFHQALARTRPRGARRLPGAGLRRRRGAAGLGRGAAAGRRRGHRLPGAAAAGPGRDRRRAERRAPRHGDRPLQAAPGDRRGRHGHGLHGRADRSRSGARSRSRSSRPGMDTRQVIARFEAERQALALMDHPNIAKVLDAGATPTRPALLRHGAGQGRPDHRLLRPEPPHARASGWSCSSRSARRCSTRTRRGSSTATSSRPTSWSARYDGVPVPKVIDFGVAKATGPKLTERTLFTAVRPARRHAGVHEPRAGGAQRPRHRHPQRHLLAGRAPLRAADRHDAVRAGSGCATAAFDEVLRIIREEEPPRPSTRLSTTEELPSIAANRGTGAEAAQRPAARRAGLDRDEGPGEGPQPPLRVGRRPSRPTCGATWTTSRCRPARRRRAIGCGSSCGGTRGGC